MKAFTWILLLGGIAGGLLAGVGVAEQASPPQQNRAATCLPPEQHNFELLITRRSETELPSWTGQIFALNTGKPAGKVSSTARCQQLAAGNYVLMLHFDKLFSEVEELRPFTFSIAENAKTTFTLLLGHSEEPEMERGMVRTGADFIETDSRRGRDYINFELPKNQPELCLKKCQDDQNCDAYSYVSAPDSSAARCWLIHGAAVPRPEPHGTSGVITRDSVPYKVTITTEPRD
jgi:hypothetical protein